MIANDKSLTTLDEIKSLGKIFVESGFFADTKDASQAVVKILVGRELGLGPMASMIGVYIVKGRSALAANVMAAKVKSSGKYDYRVLKQDNQSCEIEYFEINDGKRDSLGRSTFTIEDARRAGTQNLEKYPRNMLFARAMSNGVKWFCPDITQGLTVYEPTELGAEVDEDGKVVNATATPPRYATPDETPIEEIKATTQPPLEVHLPPGIHVPSKDNGNGDKPKNARPRVLTGFYATQIMSEAKEKGWALDEKTGAVQGQHLLNAIRAGGFTDEAITDQNWTEARDAMRKHYAEKQTA